MKWVVKFWPWLIAIFVLLLIGGVVFSYISEFSTQVVADHEKWGQFGDYFGGVLNPILSFCAFVALVFTLKEQIKANKEGEERHEEQQREQRFFQLVTLLSQSASKVSFGQGAKDNVALRGGEATDAIWLDFTANYLSRVRLGVGLSDEERFADLHLVFNEWRADNWQLAGKFIDSFFVVFSYVYWISIRDGSFSQFAFSYLKANLSENERLLMWYAAMCTREYCQYCTMLKLTWLVNDTDGSLDDPLRQYAWQLNYSSPKFWGMLGED